VKYLKWLCRSPVPCYMTGWYLIFDVATLTDILVTWPWHVYTGTCHAILIIWYLILVLTMLCLLLDIWYRYLPYYIWPMIPNNGTCHVILDIWFMTPAHGIYTDTWYVIFDTWSTILDIRHRYLPCFTWHLTYCHLVPIHLTWYCDLTGYYYSGHRTSLHTHDYHFYGDFIIILLPDIWYSWTPVLLNS